MPCKKCNSDFNVFNWKLKCGECNDKYCSKCLHRKEGIFYCKKCVVLLKRPPDPVELMELKLRDLQDYLKKHNVSTYGLVEKQDLVNLLCQKQIPVAPKRGAQRLTANFAGSVPNLRPQAIFNDFRANIESVFTPERHYSQPASPTTATPPQSTPLNPEPTTSRTAEPSPVTPRKYPKITDYRSLEELNNLSGKELKLLLALNRVDFKGCIEKSELLERVERLWIDNNRGRNLAESSENLDNLCKLCMDAPLDCVLLECGHIATCIDCGKKLAECPICRQYVIRVVRTFKA